MELMYQSTRSEGNKVTASQAILKGLADDGGLFVPVSLPKLDVSLDKIAKMNYQETAYEVMKLFFTDFTEAELKNCIEKAYDSKFDTKEIAPLVKKSDAYYLELFHGATIAFKDMALSILPHLLTTSAKKNNIKNQIVILTATSGDTGKAALAGFADVEGTSIIVFYPKNGVSKIQERQMVTQKGDNTSVVGITGNFDDAQSGVKAMYNNKVLAKVMDEHGYQFSSANSINIGRLVPQVVYYVYSYTRLLANGDIREGEPVNFVVPTGNFGNILAGYYAMQMGVPVNKLICASNSNNVLTDFIKSGTYDKNRKFFTTVSPSMDILISSNLERLIYEFCGKDDKTVANLMKELAENGKYTVSDDVKNKINEVFVGGCCSDEETLETISNTFKKFNYLCDTHTAVAVKVYEDYYKNTGDLTKTVIVSTASPYKFAGDVLSAINPDAKAEDEFAVIDILESATNTKAPAQLKELKNKEVRFKNTCEKEDMQKVVLEGLKID